MKYLSSFYAEMGRPYSSAEQENFILHLSGNGTDFAGTGKKIPETIGWYT